MCFAHILLQVLQAIGFSNDLLVSIHVSSWKQVQLAVAGLENWRCVL
jgi:hypothetical protein